MPSTAAERLQRRIDAIENRHKDDAAAFDTELYDSLDMQELLTVGLLPVNSRLRVRILGALMRDKERRNHAAEQKAQMREEEMVPVTVAGGGKCNFTIWMTKEQVERERRGA